MLSMTPVACILSKYAMKASHVSTNGARPDIGKALTEFMRAEANPVSTPCTNGDDAASAMKCGT